MRALVTRRLIALIVVVMWLFGLVSAHTLGGFSHVLLVVAVVMILVQCLQGRRIVRPHRRRRRNGVVLATAGSVGTEPRAMPGCP